MEGPKAGWISCLERKERRRNVFQGLELSGQGEKWQKMELKRLMVEARLTRDLVDHFKEFKMYSRAMGATYECFN